MCLVGLVGLDFSWYDFSGSGRRIFPPPLHTVAPGEKSKRSGWSRWYDFGGSGGFGGSFFLGDLAEGFFPRPFAL